MEEPMIENMPKNNSYIIFFQLQPLSFKMLQKFSENQINFDIFSKIRNLANVLLLRYKTQTMLLNKLYIIYPSKQLERKAKTIVKRFDKKIMAHT